jgi:hypothetical protein
MTEAFLHYVWKYRLLNFNELKTVDGFPVTILSTGIHNFNSGPDFSNAKIKIDDTTWAGNVEIHLKTSDWLKHGHQNDKAYDNIILHVVHHHDKEINSKIPVLELKQKFDPGLWIKFEKMVSAYQFVPCEKHIKDIDDFILESWLERLIVERLEQKSEAILNSLELNKNNWEETFYHLIARNFGFKINSVPFELLAKSLPLHILAKHKNSLFQIEALLFGQAGLLADIFEDEYPNKLKREYQYLRKKFNLNPVEEYLWKFMRLRPVNFPTIRIAQFAQLIFKLTNLFSKIREAKTTEDILNCFDLQASEYWNDHFMFDKQSTGKPKTFGASSMYNVIINTVVPMLFVYGRYHSDEQMVQKAMQLLEAVPAEDNSIIRGWTGIGIESKTAYQTQALIQLKNQYCVQKKCLNCAIGAKIIGG